MELINISIGFIITLIQIKFLFDFRKRYLSFNLFIILTLIMLVAIYFVINPGLLSMLSKYMGFELVSNFVLFILVIVCLIMNYLSILKIEKLKKQLKKVVSENAIENIS